MGIKKMTKEEQRIAILEHLGWTDLVRGQYCLRGTSPDGTKNRIPPNHPNNREALYDLQEKIGLMNKDDNKLRVKWINTLRGIVSRRMPKNKMGWPITSDVDVILATNEELTESILTVIGKWEK
jgi:hypothetical protein